MYYATPQQMKEIERYSDAHGVSYRELMENAGAAAAELVCRLSSKYDLSGGVMILCGKGNNGGDGFVLAKNLFDIGMTVYAVLTSGDPATELAGYEYCQLGECGIDVLDLNDNIDKVFSLFSSCSLIVDADVCFCAYAHGFVWLVKHREGENQIRSQYEIGDDQQCFLPLHPLLSNILAI